MSSPLELIPVQDSVTRQAAEMLIREYLEFIRDKATHEYGLAFDIEAMAASDLHDESKFFPPAGRFYVVRHSGQHIGVGCLKRLTPAVAEIQRMYIQPSARGLGAGRFLLLSLLADARAMQFQTVRLESLRALSAAHTLYRSVGFREIAPYPDNSMKKYQPSEAMKAYISSALFMELAL